MVLLASILYMIVSGRSPLLPFWLGASALLSFVISVALIFVCPNVKEWRIVAAINAVPFALLFLLGMFFWLGGVDS